MNDTHHTCSGYPYQYRFMIHNIHVVSLLVKIDLWYTSYVCGFPCQCRFMIHNKHIVSFLININLWYTSTCFEFPCLYRVITQCSVKWMKQNKIARWQFYLSEEPLLGSEWHWGRRWAPWGSRRQGSIVVRQQREAMNKQGQTMT